MSFMTDPQFQRNDSAVFSGDNLSSAARASVVNRTHRVVRDRARVMQARRNRVRSLMVPLAICSVLLLLTCLAVWTGLYEYQAAQSEAAQADVASLALADANNHFMVVLLWFVPVSVAIMATIWYRRSRGNAEDEAL